MKKNKIIISLCISTYNRSSILDNTILSIVNDPAFDNQVELIIGDNGSVDDTINVCKKYAAKYSNFRYYRNERNIAIYNFTKVLKSGEGLYLKLLNDTQTLKPGTLAFMKTKIVEHYASGHNILFAQNWGIVGCYNGLICTNAKQLMRHLSYHTTWSGNFGAYSNMFNSIKDINSMTKLLLPQVDWVYQICNLHGTILETDLFYDVIDVTKKGSYSFFKTFTHDYLLTLRKNINWGILYEVEKCIIFCKHIVPYYYLLKTKGVGYEYNTKGAINIILRSYWYYPYAYIFPIVYYFVKYAKKKLC